MRSFDNIIGNLSECFGSPVSSRALWSMNRSHFIMYNTTIPPNSLTNACLSYTHLQLMLLAQGVAALFLPAFSWHSESFLPAAFVAVPAFHSCYCSRSVLALLRDCLSLLKASRAAMTI